MKMSIIRLLGLELELVLIRLYSINIHNIIHGYSVLSLVVR